MRVLVTLVIAAAVALGLTSAASAAPPSALGLDLTRTAVIGDSMSAGDGASRPERAYHRRLDAALTARGGDYRSWAVPGATMLRWLHEYPERLDSLAGYRPTTVLIMLGGNDYLIGRDPDLATWHAQRLVDRVRELAPAAELVFVRYWDVCAYGFDCAGYAASGVCDVAGACADEPSPRPTWAQYTGALRWTAGQVGARYLDIGYTRPNSSRIAPDRIHLNDSGHQWLADRMLRLL